MGVFSTNQNRHFYVATGFNSTTGNSRKELDDASFAAGTMDVKAVDFSNGKELYFLYKNKKGEVIKSDYVPLKNLVYAKVFSAADQIVPLTVKKVVLDSDVNGGTVVSGQDYVLRITFRQWIGSDEKYQYVKDAAVHATAAMAADSKKFYKAMVDALNLAFSRELGASKTSNPYLTFSAGTAGSEDGIYITEKEQAWSLGTESQERVLFSVQPTTIYTGGDDVIWGEVTDTTPAKASAVAGTTGIGNGKKIADLEYFCLGERGDQYRNVGWPNVVITEGLADATKQYDVLELHFAFTDEGVNSYRSEKDITIVADTTSHTIINAIIGGINTAAGSTIVSALS